METANGRIGTASTSAQAFSVFNDDKSPLGGVLPSIVEAFRRAFPLIDFNLRVRAEGGVDIVLHELGVFLSVDFGVFLDRVAKSLTIEQYMLLGFINEERVPTSEIEYRSVGCSSTIVPIPEPQAMVSEGSSFSCITRSSINWAFEKMSAGSEAA
jgi:hypothetical protein